MIEYIEKGLKKDYRFILNSDGIVISVKKNLPLCSFKEIYSCNYADCNEMKVKCGLISNTLTIPFEEISFSHGSDAKKILYLTKLGQVDPARLTKYIGQNVNTISLDSISLSDIESLFDSYSRQRGLLSDLVYKQPKKKSNKKEEKKKATVKRTAPVDKNTFENGVLMLKDSMTYIGSSDLDYDGIEVVVLPKDLEEFDDEAFEYCEDIKEIDFRKVSHLKTIQQGLFKDLDNITSIVLPEGVTFVEDGAFSNCSSLRRIVFPSTIEAINGGFATNCPSLCDVDLSRVYKMTLLDDNFLEEDNEVTTLIIPEGVTNVQDDIVGSGVEKLYVPSTVEYIGCPCSGLTDLTVYLYADNISSLDDLCKSSITLKVHESAFETYQADVDFAQNDGNYIDYGSFPDDAPYVSKEYEQKSGYRKAHHLQEKEAKAKEASKKYDAKSALTIKVYIVADGKQEGPYDDEQFARLVEYGMVNTDTLVWQEGMAQWQKAGTVENLQRFFSSTDRNSTPPSIPMP